MLRDPVCLPLRFCLSLHPLSPHPSLHPSLPELVLAVPLSPTQHLLSPKHFAEGNPDPAASQEGGGGADCAAHTCLCVASTEPYFLKNGAP